MRTSRQLHLTSLATLTALLVSCGDHQGFTTPDGVAMTAPGVFPASAIEAAHDPGFPRLYFLPPLVPRVAFNGSFDATLLDHLAIEICRSNGASCVGDPVVVLGAGPGPTGIRLAADEEMYAANWQVRGPGLAAGDYRLNVRLGAVVIGGIAVRLGDKPQDVRNLPPDVVGIQLGRILPIKFRVERATDAVVSIRLDPAMATTTIGGSSQFTATVIGADGTPRPGEPITWTSSNTAVATVDGDGLAVGLSVGTTTITATGAGLSATAQLEVRAPDLQVTSLIAPAQLVLGSTLSLEAVATNAGNSDAPAARFRFRLLNAVNDEEVVVVSMEQPALAVGATATLSTTFTPDVAWPRLLAVEAITDADGGVAEGIESNNRARTGNFAFVAPDLTVALEAPPAAVLGGSSLTLNITTTNAGTAPAAATALRVRVLNAVDGAELSTTQLAGDAIPAGESVTSAANIAVAFEWPSPILIEVTADAGAAVTEWDEANNSARSANIAVTRPDLQVASVTAPATLPAGEALAVTATIKNTGTGAAIATDLRFRVLDAATSAELAATTLSQPAVAADGSTEIAATFPTATGWPRDVRVEVTTDAAATVRESDETNNTASSTPTTLTLPDLKVATIDVPATLPAGAAFTANATIANAGNASAAPTQTRLRVLDAATNAEVASAMHSTPTIAVGGTTVASAAFTSTRDWPRQVVVEVTSDAGATLTESDESNNVARSSILGLTDPDLVVTTVTFSATTVGLKCSLGIQAVVRNVGGGSAPAANLRFSLRNDAGAVIAFIVVAQPALAAGAEATVGGAFTAGSDWPGTVSGHAESDAANTIPEADESNNAGVTSAQVQARVALPAGYQKLWVCGSNSSWTDANNWEPAGVPATTHNVYIPAGVTYYPVLAGPQTVNDLLIDQGASVNIGTFNLTATGHVASGLMLGSSGELVMTGAAKTLRGVVPNLEINGSVALSSDASATRIIINAGRSLSMNGFTQNVLTDVSVPGTSAGAPHLDLPTESSRLVVGRHLTIGAHVNFAGGVVHVRGDFLQNGSSTAIVPTGTKLVFDGTGPQNVHFTHLHTTGLRDVEIRGPAVNFTNNLSIFGQLEVAAGGVVTQSGGNTYYTTRVPSEATPGSYRVPTSVISGTVVMVRDVSLQAGNASIVIDAGRQLNLAGFALTVGGHLTVVGSSAGVDHILMADGSPRLEVRGNMTVGGRTRLDAGTIVLRRDFVQNGSSTAMTPNGTTVVLDGPVAHAVHFTHLGTSWLDDVEVHTKEEVGGVTFTNNLTIRGQLTALEGSLVKQSGGNTYYVNRVPRELAAARYRVPTSVIAGPAVMVEDVTLASPLAAMVVDPGYSLTIGEHTLDMQGNFTVAGSSVAVKHIVMTHPDGAMKVGSMTVGGTTQLDAGVIHVRRDLVQNGASNALTTGGTKFIFDGTGAQSVHFTHLRSSWMRDVEVRGPAVNFTNNLSVFGQLDVAPGGVVTQSGGNTYYTLRVPTEATPGSYRVPTSVIDGNAVMVRNVALTHPAASIVVEPGHQLNMAGHELVVGGNFTVAGTSVIANHLLMATGSPRLEVRGLMTLGATTRLDVGTIVLRGGFTQNGASNSLTPTGTKFVFDGVGAQGVHFTHLWTSWLSDVEVRSHVNFTNNLLVAGQLTVFPGGRVTQSGGNTYYSKRVPDPTTGSYEVPTSVIDGIVVMNHDITWPFAGANLVVDPGHTLDLNGFTLQMAGNFTVAGTSVGGSHLVMPTASSRLITRDMTVGATTRLDAGTIHVRGHFTQNGASNSLTTGGTKFVFDGTGPQNVHFTHLRSSWLRDVEIRGPGVNFTNNLSVAGQLDVAAGGVVTQSGGNTYYTLRVPAEVTPASYRVPTSVIDGNAAMVRNVSLASPVAAIVVESGHQLDMGSFALTVAGNFVVAGSPLAVDHLRMTNALGRLEVGGEMMVGGRTLLQAGTIVLRKGFLQNGTSNAMIPTGTVVVFAGSGNLHFTHPGSSWLGHVQVASGGSVLTTNSTVIKGNLQLDGALHTQANTTVQGTFYWAGALTQNGAMTVAACSKGSAATFAGAGNNPCP